jgi:hypothetical protein
MKGLSLPYAKTAAGDDIDGLSSSEPGYLNSVQLAICSNIDYTAFYLFILWTRASRLGLRFSVLALSVFAMEP